MAERKEKLKDMMKKFKRYLEKKRLTLVRRRPEK